MRLEKTSETSDDAVLMGSAFSGIPCDNDLRFWEASASCFVTLADDLEHETGLLREDPRGRVYDLAERTARFGESVIRFAKLLPLNPVTHRPIEQLVGAATSVGANYCEADDSISPRDFRHRISICRKEAKETCFWLRMLAAASPAHKDQARVLWREATELQLIFGAIWRKAPSV